MFEISCKKQSIHPSVHFGNNVKVVAESVDIHPNVVINDDVNIEGRKVVLEEGVSIGKGTKIFADQLFLGYRTCIGSDCKISSIGGPADEITFGDNCFFGENNVLLVPVFLAGDYVVIHHHTLANGYRPCYIGHNTWIGQNCVLNSTEALTIGNNVGIGAYSSIYTHAYNGEMLEGCLIFRISPVVIEDNAWIVGSYNVISPGVTVGSRSIVLTSAVVFEDVPAMHTVGGVPARDLTDKIIPYSVPTLDHKFEIMKDFLREFVEEVYLRYSRRIEDGYRIKPPEGVPFMVLVRNEVRDIDFNDDEIVLVYVKENKSARDFRNVTIFDLSTKQYTKRRTEPEIQIIKFMNGYRARFVPTTHPIVTSKTHGKRGVPANLRETGEG